MTASPTVVLLRASAERRERVASILGALARVDDDAGNVGAAHVIIVDLESDSDAGLRVLESLHQTVPTVSLVALATVKDPDLILRAMRAGAREYVLIDSDVELSRAVASLLRRAEDERRSGEIIAFFSAKGGAGATTLATNLASAIAERDKRTVLVDFDRQFGDALVFLDVQTKATIAEVVQNLHRLDRDLLTSSLGRHDSGVYVLAEPSPLDAPEPITAAQVTSLLHFLAHHFDFILCDGLRGFDELSVAVLDAAARVELLLQQDVPSVKNAKHCLDVFERLGYGSGKVDVVINRYQKSTAIDLDALADNLGVEPRVTLANDFRAAVGAANRGQLLARVAPRSELTEDIADLAAALVGAPPKPRGGFLRSLFGGRRSEPPKLAKRADKDVDEVEDKDKNKDAGAYDEPRRSPEAS